MTIGQGSYEGSLLCRGQTVGPVAEAERYLPLMEHDAYFEALAEALHQARRSILILGWQFDPRTRLEPESPLAGRQRQVGKILRQLVKQRPELEVRLLIWRSPLLIAASQGFYPHRAPKWFRKRLVHFRLDMAKILGACHHQKVIVIDDKLAFCGGGDIATDRWDSDLHLDDDPRRCQPSGLFSAPRHEVMAMMSGPIALELGHLMRERWRRATGETLAPVGPVAHDPWPRTYPPSLFNIPVGVSRTEPRLKKYAEVRENEALYIEAIRRAKRIIYLENQYFTSPIIADALARRLSEPEGPEVVLVSTARSPSWFDGLTMDTARAEVLYRLEQADAYGRFFAFCPMTQGGRRIIVHSKMAIVDDRLLRIGSANLNNRSMGLDTECDVSTEAVDQDHEAGIRAFRHHTLGHFIGVSAQAFAEAEAINGGVGRTIEMFGKGRMKPLGTARPSWVEQAFAEWQLGDPMSSGDAWRPWRRRKFSRRGLEAKRPVRSPPTTPQNP